MKNKSEIKGYLLVLIATIAMSNVYIFSKAALREVSLAQFGTFWFGFALLWNIINLFFFKGYKDIFPIKKKNIWILLGLGAVEIVGTLGFFSAIKIMENPSIVSFLTNISPVYVSILGYFMLKEKLTKLEIWGSLLILTGAFVISYHPDWQVSNQFYLGLLIIVVYTFVFAFGKIISKKHIKMIKPNLLSINRVIWLFLFSFTIFIFKGESVHINQTALLNIGIGSLLGPLLAALAGYNAIKYIPASKASMLGTIKGLFVMITAYLYFDILPMTYQMIGGGLTIFGALLITFGKQFQKKN